MATINNNKLTSGLSGIIGNTVVYRQVRGRTIVTNRPRKPSRQSDWQRLNRVRFREAAAYARSVMRDPIKKEYFRLKAGWMELPNAYTAAVTLYLRKVRDSRST
jgi:hypothetical protein